MSRSKYTVDDVLEFLNNWKTRRDIAEKFELSNSESWHLVQWLEKANFVDVLDRIPIAGKKNLVKFYRKKAH